MRSSKKRSRSNQNRPRTLGNIVNRVFDSSGPEGKVRGTPQQIIEKYQALARDAQLSNDRVAAENFLQHAEHYTRMLAEAMKELAAEQEARQQQYQQQSGNGGQQHRGDRPDRQDRGDRPDRGERRPDASREFRDDRDFAGSDQPLAAAQVIDLGGGDESALIETPETAADPVPRPDVAEAAAGTDTPREERGPRRPRGPRKPRPEAKATDAAEGKPEGEASKTAAE